MAEPTFTAEESRALLELLAVASTVFEDGFPGAGKGQEMALRRIQKATIRAELTFSQAPIIGKGAGHST